MNASSRWMIALVLLSGPAISNAQSITYAFTATLFSGYGTDSDLIGPVTYLQPGSERENGRRAVGLIDFILPACGVTGWALWWRLENRLRRHP